MRAAIFMLALASCSQPAAGLYCQACFDESNCGGNPCFTDASGNRFCGAPCDACPSGSNCQPVKATTGDVVMTCFPVDEVCVAPPAGADLSGFTNPIVSDMSVPAGVDLSTIKRDMTVVPCTPPAGGNLTATGGTVDRLYFGYTGDTRPMASSSSYPSSLQTIINNIYSSMAKDKLEFAMDGGDHMEATTSPQAAGNMASYATAVGMFGKPVFMTMGNHECSQSFNMGQSCGFAGAATSDAKMAPYMTALQQISGQTSPYYRFDIMTHSGKATFIVVADDNWNTTQESWLTQQLTDADANSRFTFVSKHHPDGNADQTYFQTIYDLVTSHKYTLFLTGHSHEYKHQFTDRRAVVMGLGGAPFDNPNQMWWGYLRVLQCPDDSFQVSVVDQATGNLQDSFSVPPQ